MSWVVGRGSWVEIVSSRCLGFDGFSGIVFIKSEILITTTVVSQAFLWLGGGYVRNVWVGMCPWDSQPIPELVQLNFATLY